MIPPSSVDSMKQALRQRIIQRRLGTYEDPQTTPTVLNNDTAKDYLYSQGNTVEAKVVPPQEVIQRINSATKGLTAPYQSQLRQTVQIGKNALDAAVERRRFADEEKRLKEEADKYYNSQQGALAGANAASSYQADPNSPWQLPIQGYTVTARYGQSGPMWKTTHGGLDLAAPTGTAIRSVRPGTVLKIENHPAFGNVVWVDIGNGLTTRYGHMSKFGNIRIGDTVDMNTVLGYVGQTGNASGPHVHLGFYDNKGNTINPENYIGYLLK